MTFELCFFFYSFLVNSQKDHDLKKWSAEGLAYLSLDADVKEAIVDDPETLQALMDLSKVQHFNISTSTECKIYIITKLTNWRILK